MIIEQLDETGNIPRIIWKYLNDEQEYPAVWHVCRSPFCGCSEITFGIGMNVNTAPAASFKFDAAEKQVIETGSDSTSRLLSERLVSELSAEDRDFLVRLFRSSKLDQEEDFNPEEFEPPVFPVEDIENESLMVDYKEIFPWAKEHWFSIGEITCFVIDSYCLSSACNCQNASLDFLGYDNGVRVNGDDPTVVLYKCNSGKWETTKSGRGALSPPALMKELLRKYPDWRSVIAERRARLRRLYRRYLEYTGSEAIQEDNAMLKTAGRNDPCPCGSGKKFKKCCWGKSQKMRLQGPKDNPAGRW